MAIGIEITEELNLAGSVSVSLRPGKQRRDWQLRWELMQDALGRLDSPRTGAVSGGAINREHQELQAFFVTAIYSSYVFGDEVWMLTEDESMDWLAQKLRILTEKKLGSLQASHATLFSRLQQQETSAIE